MLRNLSNYSTGTVVAVLHLTALQAKAFLFVQQRR
jgi:hypothetical protein